MARRFPHAHGEKCGYAGSSSFPEKPERGEKLKKKIPTFLFKKASFLFCSVFRLLLRGKLAPLIFDVFLPAAKPSCPKTVRVVVVGGGGRGSSLVPLLFEYLGFEFSYPRDLSSLWGGTNQD